MANAREFFVKTKQSNDDDLNNISSNSNRPSNIVFLNSQISPIIDSLSAHPSLPCISSQEVLNSKKELKKSSIQIFSNENNITFANKFFMKKNNKYKRPRKTFYLSINTVNEEIKHIKVLLEKGLSTIHTHSLKAELAILENIKQSCTYTENGISLTEIKMFLKHSSIQMKYVA